jgi:DNA-binding NarL/FixJ family response regulator
MISVLLVEDHPILSKSITALLESDDMAVVAHARTAEVALEMLPRLNVDLAVVDVSLPGMNGIELISCLRQKRPDFPCIILSGHHEAAYVRRAIALGARGYVTKGNPPALLEGIRRVVAGEIYLSDGLDQHLGPDETSSG